MSSLKILVVDDEEGICDVFRSVLEEDRHQVRTSPTGEAALEAMDQDRFDLVFLDIKLPGMSGIDVLRQIRSRGQTVKVVMITGVLDDDLYDLSIYSDHSADGFITKPCSFHSIKECVEKVTRRSATFLSTPRDELRYAATKVRTLLEEGRQTLALAELSEGRDLSSKLPEHFGFGGPLRGSLALHGDEALGVLLQQFQAPEDQGAGFSRETARLLADHVRALFGTSWGVSLVLDPMSGTGFLAFSGEDHETVLEKQFSGSPEEAGRDACHALLVHLHGVISS